MATQPIDRIREEIRRDGPITFARFMELALYGEGGFYERPPVGERGAFVTSPHVHPVFAELLGAAVAACHDALGGGEPLLLTEVGAGDGTLLRGLLASLAGRRILATAVDVSPGARAMLRTIPGVGDVRDDLGGPFDVLVANELLDNLPFRLRRGATEIGVGLDEAGDPIHVALDSGERVLDAEDADVDPTGALALVEEIAQALRARPAYAIVIDYGTDGEGPGGPVHGYAEHRVIGEALARPGAVDITAGVDLRLLAEHAEGLGGRAFPSVSQRAALVALGFEDWFAGRLATQHAALEGGRGLDAVRAWSDKSRASLLADPGGPGRFRWLVLASPGLAAPAWLEEASALDLG